MYLSNLLKEFGLWKSQYLKRHSLIQTLSKYRDNTFDQNWLNIVKAFQAWPEVPETILKKWILEERRNRGMAFDHSKDNLRTLTIPPTKQVRAWMKSNGITGRMLKNLKVVGMDLGIKLQFRNENISIDTEFRIAQSTFKLSDFRHFNGNLKHHPNRETQENLFKTRSQIYPNSKGQQIFESFKPQNSKCAWGNNVSENHSIKCISWSSAKSFINQLNSRSLETEYRLCTAEELQSSGLIKVHHAEWTDEEGVYVGEFPDKESEKGFVIKCLKMELLQVSHSGCVLEKGITRKHFKNSVQVLISIRISPVKSGTKKWDLFDGKPDLKDHKNRFSEYQIPLFENTLSLSSILNVKELEKGDKIEILLYDQDVIFDELIGVYEMTYNGSDLSYVNKKQADILLIKPIYKNYKII